jgi:membrane associated rhomboid family serine protease
MLSCVRCERPACSACLREAAVGYQCVDCVARGARSQRRGTTIAGAEPADRSVVIPVLVAVNVVIFVITAAQAGSVAGNAAAGLFQQWGLWPTAVAGGEWWRLFTSGFLHFGMIHLAFNMLALWILGRDLEQVLGPARFLVVYLVSLLGGSMAVFLLESETTMTAGASGAVFGVMGGLAVVLVRTRRSPRPALTIILLNVAISLVPGLQISLLGHLGGLLFGVLATVGMVYAPADRRVPVQLGAVALLLALIVLAVVLRDLQFGEVTGCTTEPRLSCLVRR